MTIRKVELSDKFHIWVAATNQIINEMNNNVVLEARQRLKTVNKTTLVDSINELYDNTAHTDSDTDMDHNFSANVVSGKIKLQTGSDTHGNSYIEFWDDTSNVYRKLVYNHLTDEWYVENKQGVLRRLINEYSDIDGNNSPINVKYMTSNDNSQYTGKLAEFVYTPDIPNLYIHDGYTRGGNKLHMTDSKVKIDESDPSSGYLSDKIKGGNGVNISVSDNVMYVNNELYGQFPTNPVANNYLKRNATNGAYVNVDAATMKSDLGIGVDILTTVNAVMSNIMNKMWKVNSVYLDASNSATCPIAELIPGSRWVLISQGRALWGGDGSNANTTIEPGLPNITGSFGISCTGAISGAFYTAWDLWENIHHGEVTAQGLKFDASRSSPIYGNSSTVQPPAYRVNVWKRVA